MYSEGCSCCRDIEAHEVNKKRLAELLNVPLYSDGSGYDFSLFRINAAQQSEQADGDEVCAHECDFTKNLHCSICGASQF